MLGAFRYSRNDTWLHTDSSTSPSRNGVRAGWNSIANACGGNENGSRDGTARVSYDLNRLMRLDEPDDYVVSLNPVRPQRQDSVIKRMTHEHPIYTPESLAAQRELAALNDGRSAYHGWSSTRTATRPERAPRRRWDEQTRENLRVVPDERSDSPP